MITNTKIHKILMFRAELKKQIFLGASQGSYFFDWYQIYMSFNLLNKKTDSPRKKSIKSKK